MSADQRTCVLRWHGRHCMSTWLRAQHTHTQTRTNILGTHLRRAEDSVVVRGEA